ncbi:hypothetical protein [Virgibacillus sp. CBA3643]|uniref:hypothetical protein n=1 Tax=Virgibacillus sp. CBA3643 TaxID=2942278 RepID=UPI0035A2E61B
MSERLEEALENALEEDNGATYNVRNDDLDWFIEQAKRVEELEIEVEKQKDRQRINEDFINNSYKPNISELNKLNKRYKRALNLIEEGYRGSGEDLEIILDEFFYGGTSPVRGES